MPSQLDNLAANDFANGFTEVKQTVIRRIGGQADRTEEVVAVVEFDTQRAADTGGLLDDARGKRLEFGGLMDIATDQDNLMSDRWVIDGAVYEQMGEAIGKDGGTKTVVLLKRKRLKGRQPQVVEQ